MKRIVDMGVCAGVLHHFYGIEVPIESDTVVFINILLLQIMGNCFC